MQVLWGMSLKVERGSLKALKAVGATILLVEQNLHLVLALCVESRRFLEGPCAEAAARPEIRQACLGL